MQKIGYKAFARLENLNQINVPNSVTKILPFAFYKSNIKWDIIPSRFYQNEIPTGLFAGIDMIDFVLPQNITSVNNWAFSECKNLKSITFTDNVKEFGTWIFDKMEIAPDFKIYFESEDTKKLFLKRNAKYEQYCESFS